LTRAGSVATSIEETVKSSNDSAMTEHAFAARYGGEELPVILPSSDLGSLSKLAQIIVEKVRELAIAHALNAQWGIVTISLGASWQSAASGELNQLFRQADGKLYEAKGNGRNRVESWYSHH
jgi:diguanylate cyclase (GGDEF)-like protein